MTTPATSKTPRYPAPEIKDLPEDIRTKILEVQEKAGFVPQVFLSFARRPAEWRAFFAYHDALMLPESVGRTSNLSKGDREMIVTATSAANNCLYCVVAHGAILRIYEKKPLVADQVAVNYRKADISHKQRAMLDFAMKVCLHSDQIEDADFAPLHAHGFDDEGRQFDEKGNLVSWWTKSDETSFNTKADVMVQQFNAFEPVKGYHINGKATLGENIADLGGILLGIEAFKKTIQYKENKSIAGYTPMQRYFLGYALGWLGHTREEQLKNRLLTDVHSPAKYRVNGPFMDVDEFYTTFHIKAGTKMFVADSARVRIW